MGDTEGLHAVPGQGSLCEACMNVDGSFVGSVNLERAGIGFHSSMSALAKPGPLGDEWKSFVRNCMELRFLLSCS